MGRAAELNDSKSKRMSGWERRRVLYILVASVLGLLIAGYWLRDVVGPLLLALGLAYVLDPLVVLCCDRFRMRRGLAVFVVFFVFVASAGGGLWFLIDQGIELYRAAFGESGFVESLPRDAFAFAKKLPTWVPGREGIIELFGGMVGENPASTDSMRGTAKDIEAAVVAIGQALGTIFTVLSVAILMPIYLYYFMLDLPRIYGWFRDHTPANFQPRVYALMGRIHSSLSAFLRGRVVIAIVKGSLTALGLSLVGIPYAFVVGMVSGLLSILPFVGAGLGFVTSIALVLVSKMGAGSVIWVVVVFAIAEAIEGYVLYPLILSERLDMHPVTMLFSVLLWGTVFGIFGVLVAIPLTIVVRAIAQDILLEPLQTLASSGSAAED